MKNEIHYVDFKTFNVARIHLFVILCAKLKKIFTDKTFNKIIN